MTTTKGQQLAPRLVNPVFLDLTSKQAKVLNVGLNKISGEWDQELLARL